jgi:hypothetical protein
MSFRILGEALRDPANQVILFLRQERGLTRIKIEEEIVRGLPKPTVQAVDCDQNYICVEFSEKDCYPAPLAAFVDAFRSVQLPVKIYVALPSDGQSSTFMAELVRAKKQGVGVLLVEPAGTVNVLNEAVSLILAQLRRLDMNAYPAALRVSLGIAQNTFLSGDPAKGCSDIYDQIEDITKRIVKAAIARGFWNGQPPAFDYVRDSWHSICTSAFSKMQFNHIGTLSNQLWATVLGITRHRNETGHKPKTPKELKKRDLELKTRFEHAADILRDLTQATKGFRY